MKSEKLTFWDWIHLKKNPDFSSVRWLGSSIGAVLFAAMIMVFLISLVGLVLLCLAFIGLGPYAGDPTGGAIRNIGLVLAATFAAPFLVWRSIVAQQNADVALQSQITDRINKAVEGLGTEKTVREIIETPRYKSVDDKWQVGEDGNPMPAVHPDGTSIVDRETYEQSVPNLEVRIGAIYALERIAQDSLRDHIQIMEILCAYVRENAPVTSLEPSEPPFKFAIPRTDIQAAISVIGRRSEQQIQLEWGQEFRLDLRKTDLSGVNFNKGEFSAAIFIRSRLEAANFRESQLKGSLLSGSLLNYADFFRAELRGTSFDHAILNRPIPPTGSVVPAFADAATLNLANIYGISLVAADIRAVDYLGGPTDTNRTFGTKDTQLHPNLEFKRKLHANPLRKIRVLKRKGEIDEARLLETELYNNENFVDWAPHDHTDLAVSHLYGEFLNRLELTGWPYQG
ncbi:Pentapeptide repeats (8 copies) [Pseudovibrio axinellae]|uniref:Pentapeptide repeats (8 copies) n=1 Tax=Pseudovibrio axinellae TaxID=989403 RepID=A0A165XFH7_9HYPH|nr:pentapeptide repeat-containing protein [Pseudovibrio axinellae]KZL17658.1 Pentapeptide repeats (8 copies) [Pseudovibrio axinellae]SER44687.1 Pentapeptide repeat-containing protein [Pseudovibrio axinellae]